MLHVAIFNFVWYMIYLGLDIGSVSVKLAGIGDEDDRNLLEGIGLCSGTFSVLQETASMKRGRRPIFVSAYRRIKGEPTRAACDLLGELVRLIPQERIMGIRTTGTGGASIGHLIGAAYEYEFRAIARGVGALHPEVRTIFEMGGETSKYLLIEPGEEREGTGIADYEKNGDCAAGTGSFMDQQASRLLYGIEDVGDAVMAAETAATIAGRCSVFAKSDMIHAQQKGFTPAQILKGLCEAVVRNFKGSIVKGKTVTPVVAFVGGVAANKGVVQAMRNLFNLDEERLIVPQGYAWMGAIGAALLEAENATSFLPPPDRGRERWREVDREGGREWSGGIGGAEELPHTKPLSMEQVILLRDRVRPYSFNGKLLPVNVYLGIDVGSVSTNLAVIDEEGDLIKEIYLRTESRPIEVVNRGLREIEEEIGEKIVIRGVGTTGSGRELIGELSGADTVNDEITAHKTGAEYVAERLGGTSVDTIFEVGGQDSKFISIEDRVVVDFAMNEACAAGTGSFLEEQAERLGIKIQGEFSSLALSSKQPIRLGERCTVFMEKELVPYLQKGATKEDLVAGLAYSIALNYLNRVVRGRKIGKVIYFQGGTAYNDSVAAAFATILGKPIIVPPHNGVIGAIGMALLAREKIRQTRRATTFRGYRLDAVDYTIRSFTCKACSNYCDIQEFRVEGQKTYWGDKCSDQFRKRAKVEREPAIPDLIALRERLLFDGYIGERTGRPVVGISRSMYFYDRFPFYQTFFREIGLDVAISGPTSKQVAQAGIDAAVAEPCFPIKVAHGHTTELITKGVDYLFQPNIIDGETHFTEVGSYLCPWGQTLPFVLGSAGAFSDEREKLLVPTLHFRDGREKIARELSKFFGYKLGVPRRQVERATEIAYDAQREFWKKLREAGREALVTLDEAGGLGIVLVGRSYNINDRGVNLNIPGKLRDSYGVNVIPMDFLPIDEVDVQDVNANMFWNYGRKILQAAKIVGRYPNLHIIYITNFKCGPDSYIKHFIGEASGKPYLSLQFDGHANDAGMMTRCEAYLDSKGFLRRWNKDRETGRQGDKETECWSSCPLVPLS
jgi:predicted CoA-substrate-specific enzyme activase